MIKDCYLVEAGGIGPLPNQSIALINPFNIYSLYFCLCQNYLRDNLSPTLFSIYINDLAVTLKELNLGVDINGQKLCILLYADDLVLIAENEKDLQTLLNKMNEWCLR